MPPAIAYNGIHCGAMALQIEESIAAKTFQQCPDNEHQRIEQITAGLLLGLPSYEVWCVLAKFYRLAIYQIVFGVWPTNGAVVVESEE